VDTKPGLGDQTSAKPMLVGQENQKKYWGYGTDWFAGADRSGKVMQVFKSSNRMINRRPQSFLWLPSPPQAACAALFLVSSITGECAEKASYHLQAQSSCKKISMVTPLMIS
jgi:hypothetical protein